MGFSRYSLSLHLPLSLDKNDSNDSNGIVLSFISSQSSQGSSHISLSQLTVTISLTCVVRRQTTDDRGSGNVRSPCFKSATSGVHHIQEQRGLGTIFRRERGLSSNGGFSSGDGSSSCSIILEQLTEFLNTFMFKLNYK